MTRRKYQRRANSEIADLVCNYNEINRRQESTFIKDRRLSPRRTKEYLDFWGIEYSNIRNIYIAKFLEIDVVKKSGGITAFKAIARLKNNEAPNNKEIQYVLLWTKISKEISIFKTSKEVNLNILDHKIDGHLNIHIMKSKNKKENTFVKNLILEFLMNHKRGIHHEVRDMLINIFDKFKEIDDINEFDLKI